LTETLTVFETRERNTYRIRARFFDKIFEAGQRKRPAGGNRPRPIPARDAAGNF
jgi:hypothetical protein